MDIPFGLGAIPRPKDRRDYKVGLSQAPVQIPAVYMPDYSSIPVKMQGHYGTCGGHVGATMESFFEGQDLAPKFLWKELVKANGASQTEDRGTDMRSIFKTLQNVGVCHETLCPDVLDPTYSQYSDPSTITGDMEADAYPFGVTNYAFIDNPSWEEIKQTIYQNKVVIALVDCGDGWWKNGYSEQATCPLHLGNFASGHFIVLWGYDQQYIYFRNYWSDGWGRHGDGYFDISYLSHVREIGAGIASVSTRQKIANIYQRIIKMLEDFIASHPKTASA